MRIRETNGHQWELMRQRDYSRLIRSMETSETQNDYRRLMRSMGTYETQRD